MAMHTVRSKTRKFKAQLLNCALVAFVVSALWLLPVHGTPVDSTHQNPPNSAQANPDQTGANAANSAQSGSNSNPPNSAPANQNPPKPGQAPEAAGPAPDTIVSRQEAKELFKSVDEILKFASDDTSLPIKHEVKRRLASRDEVQSYIRKSMKDDKVSSSPCCANRSPDTTTSKQRL
jgi:hypothetical protein